MSNTTGQAWSQPEQFDPMVSMGEEDFATFLEIGDMNLDFPVFDTNIDNLQSNGQPPREETQIAVMQDAPNRLDNQSLFGQHHGMSTSTAHRQPLPAIPDMTGISDGFSDLSYQSIYGLEYQQSQEYPMQNQNIQQQSMVPPTPNSVEMHADAGRYLQYMDAQTRAIMEQRYQLRKQDSVINPLTPLQSYLTFVQMAFTPLVSPAVTPHDAHFQLPMEFTVPGAYFSPLTSPALEAQKFVNRRPYHTDPHTAESSVATSPATLDVDMLDETLNSPQDSTRRTKRKMPTSRPTGASTCIRQSPIVKPQRRKGTLSSVIPPKEVSDLLMEVQRSKISGSHSPGFGMPHSQDTSEAESVSPEPLSDAVMGPPPRPGSSAQSPSIRPQYSGSSGSSMGPATPASLMQLRPSQKRTHMRQPSVGEAGNSQDDNADSMLDDLTLPEAATTAPARPPLQRLDTAMAVSTSEQSTTRLSVQPRKTPKLGPLSTPNTSGMAASPAQSATNSPTATKRPEPKGGRGNASKKRNSTSSALVSPALRPKISPSVKPLLPDGAAISDSTHALLLASKSNYQNILEGTHLPGVSYPESLSTNLTSKRTSHKLAEQGRRNRINTALQEMQALLPSPAISATGSGGGSGCGSGSGDSSKGVESAAEALNNGNSKAATVESAIEYIRVLKMEAEKKDQEVERLRKELSDARATVQKNETA
ncbi:hypothetical protein LTR16_002098 [Cryomyces antarcticus]|uniref:BHLH domain-containing protein n=1 Tax=Cryomyces antarcticus TaxID=329879 RepID=A0ABR0LR56_9PEZI|nr:hypothetical protein LTR16_002098 [Cryomyces antarcticus]